MTTADVPGFSGPTMNALVEALDRRARQAGSEGATTVIRGMLASITEVLSGLEARLERIEIQLDPGEGGDPAHELQVAIAGVHDRLARLEDAFVQAVETSTEGADAMVGELRAAIVEVLPEVLPAPAPPAVDEEAITAAVRQLADKLASRLDAVEKKLDHARAPAAGADPRVLTAIAQLSDVVRGFEDSLQRRSSAVDLSAVEAKLAALATDVASLRSRTDRPESGNDRVVDAFGELRRDWEAAYDKLDRSIGAVRAELDGLAPGAPDAATSMELRAVRAELERLGRDEKAGRIVGLVEARLSGAVDAIVKRAEASLDAVRALRSDMELTSSRLEDLAAAVDTLATAVESIGARVERDTAAAVEQMGGRVVERLAAEADQQSRDLSTIGDAMRSDLASLAERLTAAAGRESSTGESETDRVVEAIRREAEMLTQRVAALGKTIDAIRGEVEEQNRRSEASLGRKAGEIGRRLAADFGISTKRPDERRDPRELGRGAGPGRR